MSVAETQYYRSCAICDWLLQQETHNFPAQRVWQNENDSQAKEVLCELADYKF